MVGKLWMVGVCALTLGVPATNAWAQAEQEPEEQQPESTIRTADQRLNAVRGRGSVQDLRDGRAVVQQPEAAGTFTFLSGLETGFTGVYEFTRAIEYTEQMGDDASSRETMSENVSMVLRVASKGPRRDGMSGVLVSFDRYRARLETAEGPVSVDFDLTADLPEDAEALTGAEAMLPKLKNTRVQMLVDASGNVTSIEGLPDPADVFVDGAAGAELFSVLDQTQFAVLLSKLFNAEGGVERTSVIKPSGDNTWTTIEEVPMGPSGTLVVTRSWAPRVLTSGEIEARGTYGASMNTPPTPNDAAPVCEIASYQGVARMLWREEGGLGYLNSTEAIALAWTLGAETLRTAQESVTTINRLEE
ncbi:MAG: hypothetical protein Tsb0013_05550 [Phycisphaerales bacterium]